MRVLVTGGAGFIGSHLVDLLIEEGHQVAVVDALKETSIKYINPQAVFYETDIRSEELEHVFETEKPEIVYHLAAQSVVPPSIKDPLYDQSVNVGGTIRILELMKKYESRKIIYSSSAAVYGDPVQLPITEEHPIQPKSPYGLSKHIAEQYLALYYRMYGLDYTIFRYANIYGPRQTAEGEGGVVSIFIDKLLNGETPVINGDGRHTRDFVFVKDVAQANVLAMTAGSQKTVNVSSGKAVSVLELLEQIQQAMGTAVEPRFGPERAGDIVHSTLDPTAVWESIQWKASTPLPEGLQQTIAR